MILLMNTKLTMKVEPEEDTFPGSWFYNKDITIEEEPGYSVFYEEELHLPGGSARGDSGVFDLEDDGILDGVRQLHQLGVRGSIHFADSCGPEYICITLVDVGIFKSTGVVRWNAGPVEVTLPQQKKEE